MAHYGAKSVLSCVYRNRIALMAGDWAEAASAVAIGLTVAD